MKARTAPSLRALLSTLAALAVLALLVATSAAAQRGAPQRAVAFSPKERQKLASIVATVMVESRLPGVTAGVWVPGRGSWVRSFGTADLTTVRPMRPTDHFRIASITKTFTATAALQLVDDGKLSLEDRLSSYVTGIANGDRITIRQLLDMTSGIFDFTSDAAFLKRFDANPLIPFSPRDVIAIVKRHKPAFAPGAKAVYCDTNYILLGLIVEKVTGQPVERVIRDRILRPLRMRHTSFPTTPAMPSPVARGYYAGDDGLGPLRDYTASNPAVGWTAGAMISTLADVRIWAKALATGTLLTKATQAERLKFVAFHNPGGVKIGYGLGIFRIGDFVGHNGAILGYTTAMFYLPSNGATIVVEGNKSTNFSTDTTTIFFAIAQHLFPRALTRA